MTSRRARLLGAVVAAAVAATMGYAQFASAGAGATPRAVVTTADPTASPGPEPTLPSPTPVPSDPAGSCGVPLPEPSPTGTGTGTGTEARSTILAGPVTCDDGESVITVSWDGTNIKIVIAAAKTKEGSCELDPTSVKVTQPNNGTVDKNGVVTVPYDKDKKVKITIKIDYDLKCTLGGENFVRKYTATIEFTPPDGPISIASKPR